MANENNLKKGKATQFKSGEEAARNGKKGGKKSGESKREKKAFRELADLILSAENKDKELIGIAKKYGIAKPDNKTLVVLGLTRSAIHGNHNAFDRLIELMGETNEATNDEKQKQTNFLKAIKEAVSDGDK